MERRDDGDHYTEDEASGGTRGHGVRYVLVIGLILAIGFLSLIWITGALSQ